MAGAVAGMTMAQMAPMLAMSASGAMQAMGSYQQGKQAEQSANATAANLEQQASNRMRAASMQEDQLRANARQIVGQQLAMGAQSGVGLSGSRLDALRQSYDNVEADAAGLRTDALIDYTGMRNQASVARWQGKQAKKAGRINALSNVLSAAASVGTYVNEMQPDPLKSIAKQTAGQEINAGWTSAMPAAFGSSSLLKPTVYGAKGASTYSVPKMNYFSGRAAGVASGRSFSYRPYGKLSRRVKK